jgi:hypothetical protein
MIELNEQGKPGHFVRPSEMGDTILRLYKIDTDKTIPTLGVKIKSQWIGWNYQKKKKEESHDSNNHPEVF